MATGLGKDRSCYKLTLELTNEERVELLTGGRSFVLSSLRLVNADCNGFMLFNVYLKFSKFEIFVQYCNVF